MAPAVSGASPDTATAGDTAGLSMAAYVGALAVAAFAFLFRLLAVRSLPNDHYLYLSAAQQILLGEIPGRDFVEPGMLLQFLLSAAAQALTPGPASEAILTATILAMAGAATTIGVSWLTRSVAAGVLAALFQVLMQPRLYSFPKITVPAVLVLFILVYARRPRMTALVPLAAWVAVAFLLRHDIGIYAGLGAATAVALSHRTMGAAVRGCATLTAAVLLLLLPYLLFLSWNGGIAEHVRGSFEYGKAEWHQLRFPWPTFTFDTPDDTYPWTRSDAAAFFFYAAYALPVVAVLLLARAENRRNTLVRSGIGGAIAVAVLYAAIILRHPLVTRVQDLAGLYALLGAWCAMTLLRATRAPDRPAMVSLCVLTRASLAAVLAVAVLSIDVLGEVRVELRVTGLTNSMEAAQARARAVVTSGRTWPWSNYWPAGDLPPAINYLNACLGPDQRIWVTWLAPEYYVFARRGFGAGHPMTMAPYSFTTPQDQNLMIVRLEGHRVPIVLINESSRAEFAGAYPQVEEYLRTHFVPAAQFTIRGDAVISIAVRRGLKATDAYGEQKWPCHLVPDDPSASSA